MREENERVWKREKEKYLMLFLWRLLSEWVWVNVTDREIKMMKRRNVHRGSEREDESEWWTFFFSEDALKKETMTYSETEERLLCNLFCKWLGKRKKERKKERKNKCDNSAKIYVYDNDKIKIMTNDKIIINNIDKINTIEKLADRIEGNQEAPFLRAAPLSYCGGHCPFPWIVPLNPYHIILRVNQGWAKYHFGVFAMIWPRIEHRSPNPLAITLTLC